MFRYEFPEVGISTVVCCNEHKGCFAFLFACGISQKYFSGYLIGFLPSFNEDIMGEFTPYKVPIKLDMSLYQVM